MTTLWPDVSDLVGEVRINASTGYLEVDHGLDDPARVIAVITQDLRDSVRAATANRSSSHSIRTSRPSVPGDRAHRSPDWPLRAANSSVEARTLRARSCGLEWSPRLVFRAQRLPGASSDRYLREAISMRSSPQIATHECV